MPERAGDRSADVAQTAGQHIVNNSYEITESGESAPAFAEEAAPAEGRQTQWQRVRAARADGRLCRVFASRTDYERCKAQAREPQPAGSSRMAPATCATAPQPTAPARPHMGELSGFPFRSPAERMVKRPDHGARVYGRCNAKRSRDLHGDVWQASWLSIGSADLRTRRTSALVFRDARP